MAGFELPPDFVKNINKISGASIKYHNAPARTAARAEAATAFFCAACLLLSPIKTDALAERMHEILSSAGHWSQLERMFFDNMDEFLEVERRLLVQLDIREEAREQILSQIAQLENLSQVEPAKIMFALGNLREQNCELCRSYVDPQSTAAPVPISAKRRVLTAGKVMSLFGLATVVINTAAAGTVIGTPAAAISIAAGGGLMTISKVGD